MKTNIKNNSEITPSNARTRVLIFLNSKLLYSNEKFEKPAKNKRRPLQLYNLKWSPFRPVYFEDIFLKTINVDKWMMLLGRRGKHMICSFDSFVGICAFFARGICDNGCLVGVKMG